MVQGLLRAIGCFLPLNCDKIPIYQYKYMNDVGQCVAIQFGRGVKDDVNQEERATGYPCHEERTATVMPKAGRRSVDHASTRLPSAGERETL